MSAENNLFFEDTVFVCDRTTQEEVFTEIANKLSLKNYVAPAFLENIMDMSVVDPEFPSFAVPHTEVEFVHTRRIVPVKLTTPVEWHSMIDPSQTFPVSFLFMILNDDKEAQVGILAKIMDFVNALGTDRVKELFSMTDAKAIYQFLVDNFPAD